MNLTCKYLRAFVISLCITMVSAITFPAAQATDTSHTWLQFSILEIKCVDESNNEVPERWGDDDISLGGTAVSRYGVDKIAYRSAGDFKKDGTTRQYGDWIFAEIPFTAVSDYTRVQLSLVERDPGGGKEDHLEQLVNTEYTLTQQQIITDFLTLLNNPSQVTAAQQLDAAYIPGFEALLGLALETTAKVVITIIVTDLWDQLVRSFEDDFFPSQTVDAPDFADPTIAASGVITGQIHFVAHKAHYQVTYQWQPVTKTGAESEPTAYQPYLSFSEVVADLRKVYDKAIAGRTIFLPLVASQTQ